MFTDDVDLSPRWVVTVQGHALTTDPKTGLVSSRGRAQIGPGYVCAKTRRDSLVVAVTTWVNA
jgi:hypothetical protein